VEQAKILVGQEKKKVNHWHNQAIRKNP